MNWLDIFGDVKGLKRPNLPMYAVIVGRIRESIQFGQLADNTRLPANRELAELLDVDRSTVSRAYLELEKLGLVHSHVGRGTFVRVSGAGAGGSARASAEHGCDSMVWPAKYSRASQAAFAMLSRQPGPIPAGSDVISFAGGIPSQEFYPYEEFRAIVARLLRTDRSADMFGYSPAEGNAQLRAEVRRYLKGHGISAGDDELLIVSGSQQAIDVVASTLVDPGDVVVVEDPTYFWAMCNFSAGQARCLPVPVDEDGLQLDVLEAILSRERAKLLYLMPTFQNPTGATLSLKRRLALLELARQYQMPVLEDNFVGDLRYDGQPLPSLRALDRSGEVVIHQGTFSKALCPGLRLGWLLAPAEVMSRLRLAKRAGDLSTNSLSQAIMAEYLRRGYYDKHLAQIRDVYRSRRDTMCAALARHAGNSIRWWKPEGGMFVWCRLPQGCSARELLGYAERDGVSFSPGDMFFVNGDRAEFFRLSFIQNDEQTIERGIEKLGQAIAEYTATRAQREDAAVVRGGEATLV